MKVQLTLVILLTCLLSAGVMSQSSKESEMKKYSEDHESIEKIIAAAYDTISGEKGEARDWDRFRSLFHPKAHLIPTGAKNAAVFTVDEYIKQSEPVLVGEGFFEKGIASRKEVYGSIAQVFSTYEARKSKSDTKPFMRGINSFQLFFDGERWWILNILWRAESGQLPIPAKYLESMK